MNKRLYSIFLLLLSCSALSAPAVEADADKLQNNFETRYQTFLAPNSLSKLPFDELTKAEWKKLQADSELKIAFQKQDVFYQGKTYVFTLYQSTDGRYYLHAKGGFWGMEELIYGPIAAEKLQ